MTDEEVLATYAKIPEATDEEIAVTFCTYALFHFDEPYREAASTALVAAKARGLTLADLMRLSGEAREKRNAKWKTSP